MLSTPSKPTITLEGASPKKAASPGGVSGSNLLRSHGSGATHPSTRPSGSPTKQLEVTIPSTTAPAGESGGGKRKYSPLRKQDPRESSLLNKLQSKDHHRKLYAKGRGGAGGDVGQGSFLLQASQTTQQGGSTKLRKLTEFFDLYPATRPQTVPDPKAFLFAGDMNNFNKGERSTGNLHASRSTVAGAEREMRRIERETAAKRVAKDRMTNATDNNRQRKIDQWVQLADKNNRKLKKENDALAKVATLVQENCINNDTRYDEALNNMRLELEYTTIFRQDHSEITKQMKESFGALQDRIGQIRTSAEKQAQADFLKLKEEFEQLLDEQANKLDRERTSGNNTTEEWREKNRSLQDELEKLLYQIDAAHEVNQKLKDHHKLLQVKNSAQSNDASILERQFHGVSAHHQRLKDRIHDLEVELAQQDGNGVIGGGDLSLDSSSHGGGEDILLAMEDTKKGMDVLQEEKGRNYSSSLKKAQQLLEMETQNLRAVRHAHVLALKQRTELEVYLRQAIIHFQKRFSSSVAAQQGTAVPYPNVVDRGPGSDSPFLNPTQYNRLQPNLFNADDRRRVVELLLSKPRVLQLLYAEDQAAAERDILEEHELTQQQVEQLNTTQRPTEEKDTTTEEQTAIVERQGSSWVSVNPSDVKQALSHTIHSSEPQEIHELWGKWKNWTLAANKALEDQGATGGGKVM